MIRLEVSQRSILTLFVLIAVLWLVFHLSTVLILMSISLILAAALLPFVEWLGRKGLGRGVAVLVVALLLLAGVAATGLVVVPAVVAQGRELAEHLPEMRQNLVLFLDGRRASTLAREVEQVSAADLVKPTQVASTGRRVLGALTSTVTVLVLTIYILLDARRIERFVYFSMPKRYHEHVQNLLPALRETVGGYVRGQLVTSALITAFTFVVLFTLGIPNALALAVLAGVTDMIPMIGALLAIVPATLAALSISTATAIIVGALLLVYQEFENRVLVPRVYGSTLRLPAVVVFVALLIGAEVAGVVGAVLSLPFAAALRVFIEYAHGVRHRTSPAVTTPGEPFAPDTAPARAPGGDG